MLFYGISLIMKEKSNASALLNAQGLGFYLGGKRVELVEGDSINFVNNDKGQVEVKVNKDGQVEVYRGEEMTFYGDIERYLLDINNATLRDQWIKTVLRYYNGCQPTWSTVGA